MTLLGFKLDVKVNSNLGRMDAVIETDTVIHIMEFKVNGTAEERLAQIKKKDYVGKYEMKRERVVIYGVEVDAEIRNIGVVLSEDVGQ